MLSKSAFSQSRNIEKRRKQSKVKNQPLTENLRIVRLSQSSNIEKRKKQSKVINQTENLRMVPR